VFLGFDLEVIYTYKQTWDLAIHVAGLS